MPKVFSYSLLVLIPVKTPLGSRSLPPEGAAIFR